ncbi:MAG TPA: thioredoxin domain-containing protein [Solirubrobacteraceae bacterium]
MLVAALVIVVIAVAVGGGNGGPKAVGSKTAKAKVAALLHGIPQTASVAGGIQLGNPKAPVTITEYGDLVCPICQEFAVGDEEQIIKNYVRTGKAQIIFRADETASATANNGEFSAGQVAARSAALQKLGWNYIYTWYEEQQSEDTPYVTDAFLQGLAKQIPGLNYGKWHTQLQNPNLAGYVTVDERAMNSLASSLPQGNATPTVIIKGPKGSAPPIQGLAPYSTFQTYIKGVS